MSKANKPQDVSGTSPGLANSIKEVKTLHDGIVKRDKDSVQDAIRIGNLLPEIQASRGRDWKTWVGKNCGFSYMQARIYMRLALWVADGGKLSTQDRLMSAYQKAGIKKKADPKPGKNSSTASSPFRIPKVIRAGKNYGALVSDADGFASLSASKDAPLWLKAGMFITSDKAKLAEFGKAAA